MAHRKAASVLPDPVGAETSACRPDAIASQAPVCAAVGAANAEANQDRVAVENRASTGSSVATTTEEHDRPAQASPNPGYVGLRNDLHGGYRSTAPSLASASVSGPFRVARAGTRDAFSMRVATATR